MVLESAENCTVEAAEIYCVIYTLYIMLKAIFLITFEVFYTVSKAVQKLWNQNPFEVGGLLAK